MDPEIFYPASEVDDHSEQYAEDVAFAATYCNTCPAQLECLRTALDKPEDWGVWGGVGRRERRSILRRNAERGLALQCVECNTQLHPETIRAKKPLCAGCSPFPLEETA